MSNYNLSINFVDFTFSTSEFNLSLKITGNEFPVPDNTTGALINGLITFSMASSSGETCNEATFSIQTGDLLNSYNFSFNDLPDGSPDITGNMNSVIPPTGGSNPFLIGEVCVKDMPTNRKGGLIKGNKKIDVTVGKKPGIMKNYTCTSAVLDSKNILQLGFAVTEKDNLSTSVNNVDGAVFTKGLPITAFVDGEDAIPCVISEVCLID